MDKFEVKDITTVKKILSDIDYLTEKGYWPNQIIPDWCNEIIRKDFNQFRVTTWHLEKVAYRACVDYLLSIVDE